MSQTFLKKKVKPPKSLQGILWSKDTRHLDLEKDKVYIIHQVLSYGNFKQIKWLFKVYKPKEIQEVFLRSPKKIYSASVFYFVKNFILGLRKKKLFKQKYVKIALRALK